MQPTHSYMEGSAIFETACTLDSKTNFDTLNAVGKASPFLSAGHVAENMTNVVRDNKVMALPSGLSVMDFIEANRFNLVDGRPFHVLDTRVVEQRHAKWAHYLPRVDPFYAMKCNTDPVLMRTLFAHGAGFDCASRREIELAVELGCSVDRIIFANPAKLPSDLEYAASIGVTKMTFDSEDELVKIAEAYRRIGGVPAPVIRIVTDDSHSVCKFSQKFGAALDDCKHLLEVAAKLGLPVIGVSFHVGSGCASVYSFTKAIRDARKVFDDGIAIGHPMHLLDLGGGWPGDDNGRIAFPTIASAIAPLLNELFPATCGSTSTPVVSSITGNVIPAIHIIAEPGRYFSHASMIFATPIISRRNNLILPSWTTKGGEQSDQPHVLYYIGDGVYGAFNCILYDHYTPETPTACFTDAEKQRNYKAACAEIVAAAAAGASEDELKSMNKNLGLVRAKVFGPTCDGLDTIFDVVPLPLMEVGEWLLFPNMGAYTVAAQSSFNGVPRPPVLYVRSCPTLHDFVFDGKTVKSEDSVSAGLSVSTTDALAQGVESLTIGGSDSPTAELTF